MRIEHTIEIDAPIERVWALTLDVEAWPEHTPTLTRVERLDAGPLAVGAQARIKQPAQRERVWTVTAIEPERRFAWATRMMGTTMTGGHHLTRTETGTMNTLTVDIEGPLASLVGLALRGPIQKAIATENRGFKAAAER